MAVNTGRTPTGRGARNKEPATASARPTGTAPAKSPAMNPAASDPRRTDEDSAQALFRLQTEPDNENAAMSAATNQVKPRASSPRDASETTITSAVTITAR